MPDGALNVACGRLIRLADDLSDYEERYRGVLEQKERELLFASLALLAEATVLVTERLNASRRR